MAGELIATGVVLSIGDGVTPTEAFTVMPGVVGLPDFPALTLPDIEVTALDSTGAEYISGIGDGGDFNFTLNLRKKTTGSGWNAAQQALEGYLNDGLLHGIRIVVSSGATVIRTYNAKGSLKEFRPNAPSANSAITASVSFKLSGAVVIS